MHNLMDKPIANGQHSFLSQISFAIRLINGIVFPGFLEIFIEVQLTKVTLYSIHKKIMYQRGYVHEVWLARLAFL